MTQECPVLCTANPGKNLCQLSFDLAGGIAVDFDMAHDVVVGATERSQLHLTQRSWLQEWGLYLDPGAEQGELTTDRSACMVSVPDQQAHKVGPLTHNVRRKKSCHSIYVVVEEVYRCED